MTVVAPARSRPSPVLGHVLRAERLTPGLVRIVVGGPGMALFAPSPHADSYVKLVFLPAGERPLQPDGRLDIEAVRAALPEGAAPRQRAYTVRAFDPAAHELTIDLVVHGDAGLAGPWAASVVGGEEVVVMGPGGAWSPSPDMDHHLLVGDASALPAVAVALERLPADARGVAILEVGSADEELALHAPAGIEVRWVHTRPGAPGDALVEAATAWPWPDGSVGVFVHGEAGAVRALRSYLRVEREVPRDHLSISGYWRRGVDDEGWRAGKREWTASIESAERAAGLD
ncbi:siderophore-interacting protein [Cellulomonas edaphi]|uniref:Siderophore-interacting protein n=1 Tax=Cellulomonas edaphi TaxID=3053468 RepID=A0ABT7S528_9CELL|nr:siderophore-interacting protein [Cellulomons edaphi]MDM7830715.1 siderophore-interacting protein [Cellulomons edaphi]